MSYVDLQCEIIAWLDDEPQPGIVEARVVDVDGREWRFIDKIVIFDAVGDVGPWSVYPCPGTIRCQVLDENAGPGRDDAVWVSTATPHHVESVDEQTRFLVRRGQLAAVA